MTTTQDVFPMIHGADGVGGGKSFHVRWLLEETNDLNSDQNLCMQQIAVLLMIFLYINSLYCE